jgi:hypothetical protein
LLAQDRWFSHSTPVSFTTKTFRHAIAEILLKVALNIKIQIQKIQIHSLLIRNKCQITHYRHIETFGEDTKSHLLALGNKEKLNGLKWMILDTISD